MHKRWSMAKRWQKAALWSRFVTKFEDNCRRNRQPPMGEATLLCMFLELILPWLGFKVWDSLLNENEWARLEETISQCAVNLDVYSWAERALSRVDGDAFSHLSEVDATCLNELATIFKLWFAPVERPQLPFEVMDTLAIFRKELCDGAFTWLSQKRQTLMWDKENSWAAYEEQAMTQYKAWKVD
ncbi:unnamed protein product [Calypogeia fissa]